MTRNIEDAALAPVVWWGRIGLLLLLSYWSWQFLWTPLSPDAMERRGLRLVVRAEPR